MHSQIYAATDLQITGSILLKRNRIFEFVSRSLKRVNFSIISLNNFERKSSQSLQENKK